jgi:hypothetical protein
VFLHGRPGASGIPGQDRLDDPGVLRVQVVEIAAKDGNRRQQPIQSELHVGDR